ncbi:hypothetical protein DACRYDRAFT_24617 [Dacryopinax primogenitus]|uniref:F-box domain-containing protein n=1 Tax=Dacryopinax primogenitus (strain DJM 731) TaxID=1858805 RepID=M5FR42_DACPD|nr:uncharacterized protein DACRYDRAFT_24617 [Dacryopinax primogenitus]EJT98078.1 hypothetical protein DACRYDRAFT_24617 [Dacryopinax primogenitus]
MPTSALYRVPPEVWEHIFSLVEPLRRRHGWRIIDTATLLRSALVCKAWRLPALRQLYHTIRVPNDCLPWAEVVTRGLTLGGPSVSNLIFEPAEWIWDNLTKPTTTRVILDGIPLVPRVQRLSIHSPLGMDEADFDAILGCMSALPRLKKIEWARTFFPAQKSGEVDMDVLFRIEHIQRLREILPNLQNIWLGPILSSSVTSTPIPQWMRLTSLALESVSITNEELYHILCDQHRLRHLDLNYTDSLTQAGIVNALKCVKKTLRSLRLAGTFKPRPVGTPTRAFQPVLREFTALRLLRTTLRAPAFSAAALVHPPPILRRWKAWDVMPGVGPDVVRRFIETIPRDAGDRIEFVFTVRWESWETETEEARVRMARLTQSCQARGLSLLVEKGQSAATGRPAEGEVAIRSFIGS